MLAAVRPWTGVLNPAKSDVFRRRGIRVFSKPTAENALSADLGRQLDPLGLDLGQQPIDLPGVKETGTEVLR
jgi:hypothetical protein